MTAKNRSELIKAVVNEIKNPASDIIKNNHIYIIQSHSLSDITNIEIADFAGHYCIIVHYKTISEEESYETEKGLSTFKGKSCWQGISLTPRSPAYKKFKEILEAEYAERSNKKIT